MIKRIYLFRLTGKEYQKKNLFTVLFSAESESNKKFIASLSFGINSSKIVHPLLTPSSDLLRDSSFEDVLKNYSERSVLLHSESVSDKILDDLYNHYFNHLITIFKRKFPEFLI